jgi:hypothetical protein
MRRTFLVALVAAAMLVASALPALAQGPPITPPGAGTAIEKAEAIEKAFGNHRVISVNEPRAGCVSLNAPPGSTIDDPGHHSFFCL